MEQNMASLQRHRDAVLRKLGEIGDFRPGSIAEAAGWFQEY